MNRAVLVALLLLAPIGAHASTIYKCTDAKGMVTMQNDKPCAPGEKQEVRVIGELPTAPAPAARTEHVAPPSVAPPGAQFELVRGPVTDTLPASTVDKTERKPPPALFECTTWDKKTFLTENGTPEDRCAPLNTVGLNGDPNFGAGQACETRTDTCVALTDKALCQGWQRRIDESKFRMTYAAPADKAARKADYDDQVAKFIDTTCR